jgi:GNAT superfamily N-acetyltransferase
MKIALRQDLNPDPNFYYRHQFKIYEAPYLIWDKDTWEGIISSCDVYRIEVEGKYAGDVILEERGKRTKLIVDFSLLPQYQGKGIGKAVLEQVKVMGKKMIAVTRKETLDFFLKSGFISKMRIKNYYHTGVDGYYITFSIK